MRNIYQFLLLLFFYLTPCVSSDAQSGSVQKYTEKLDSIVAPDSKDIYEYDDSGYLIKNTTYSFDANRSDYVISKVIEYERNEQGQATKEHYYSRDKGTGEIISIGTFEYVYDEKGREVENSCYSNGTIESCHKFIYDGDIKTDIYYYYSNNVCVVMSTKVYDIAKDYRLIKEESFYYDNNGQITSSYKHEDIYDIKGNVIKETSCKWQNNTWIVIYETIYEFDVAGNNTKKSSYSLEEGELHLVYQDVYQYNGNNLEKEVHCWYRYENGERITESESFREYDSKGNIIEDNNYKYERKFDRYGDLIEATKYFKFEDNLQSWHKVECSYDADGNLIVIFYGHFKDGLQWLNPSMSLLPWYALEKHVIALNVQNEVESVTVYEMVNGKWIVACEGIYPKGITVSYYLKEYDGLQHGSSIIYDHHYCLTDAIKQVCYDHNGNAIYECGHYYSFENEYGGHTEYGNTLGGVRRTAYNEFGETMSREIERFVDGEWKITSWESTDEYYSDFTPIVQTIYNDGIFTRKTIYTYDWDVDVNTISGYSKRHKLLSEEVIDENNNSSFTRYYYSKISVVTGMESVSWYNENETIIYDVTGKQHNSLQKGLNIINEGGKVRKVIVK